MSDVTMTAVPMRPSICVREPSRKLKERRQRLYEAILQLLNANISFSISMTTDSYSYFRPRGVYRLFLKPLMEKIINLRWARFFSSALNRKHIYLSHFVSHLVFYVRVFRFNKLCKVKAAQFGSRMLRKLSLAGFCNSSYVSPFSYLSCQLLQKIIDQQTRDSRKTKAIRQFMLINNYVHRPCTFRYAGTLNPSLMMSQSRNRRAYYVYNEETGDLMQTDVPLPKAVVRQSDLVGINARPVELDYSNLMTEEELRALFNAMMVGEFTHMIARQQNVEFVWPAGFGSVREIPSAGTSSQEISEVEEPPPLKCPRLEGSVSVGHPVDVEGGSNAPQQPLVERQTDVEMQSDVEMESVDAQQPSSAHDPELPPNATDKSPSRKRHRN